MAALLEQRCQLPLPLPRHHRLGRRQQRTCGRSTAGGNRGCVVGSNRTSSKGTLLYDRSGNVNSSILISSSFMIPPSPRSYIPGSAAWPSVMRTAINSRSFSRSNSRSNSRRIDGTSHCSTSASRWRIVSTSASPSASAAADNDGRAMSRTERIMRSLPDGDNETGGAGGVFTYDSLKRADANWRRLRDMKTGPAAGPAPQFVRRLEGVNAPPPSAANASREESTASANQQQQQAAYDVAVCGGTLGVFVAAALVKAGKKVVIVERAKLQGRAQEWNISRKELEELVEVGVLEEEDIDHIVAVTFNPNRCGFNGGRDVWVSDILNLGVSPLRLIECVKQKFVELGGEVMEEVELEGVQVYDDSAVLSIKARDGQPQELHARLVVDAMGNFSPIVRQIRWGQKPDGVCLVVGSCARGFAEETNTTSDIIFTNSPLVTVGKSQCQLFWEAFPAGSGPTDRTTYLFTYIDAEPKRPDLEELLEVYWDLMPQYQGVNLDDLSFLRVLFGFFPTYRNSPLPAVFDRVIQVGDASGIQSPLSFGGFGSITRHLKRISGALLEALDFELLSSRSLGLINQYQPNLSGAWLLQRAMAPSLDAKPPPNFINELLSSNFASMERLGDPVLRPFLQDVTQFSPLALTMGSMVVSQPQLLPDILKLVGVVPLADWTVHFVALGLYTAASSAADAAKLESWVKSLPPGKQRFEWQRRLEALKFGAGLDYKL